MRMCTAEKGVSKHCRFITHETASVADLNVFFFVNSIGDSSILSADRSLLNYHYALL